ncbi:MAG: protein arginine kinase [Clostridium argentinense]|uniref:Protein-arginine kinase n=1 Tax=Clostridium faecium TaxID=2762223 RepID=A0ABR8YTV8_9CLOT|nr:MULTISPECIES: protein arginine kinase [Clostridium]MBD8047660.1 protein arginine kinase [Clostridium faecium]MBS5824534.1 protein arginine kinase [Clostridium argentinense]MDU1350783.1 protein arginine kinase [Clostridium argentinense]
MENWIKAHSENDDIVLSSRIRLARNIKGYPFPNKLSKEKAMEIVKKVESAFYTSSYINENFKTVDMNSIDPVKMNSYFEKHLISEKLILNKDKSAFILDKDEIVSIMINEEDHLRMQYIVGGLNLKKAYEEVDKIDNLLEEKLEFVFDSNLGYLTACPTNAGTGLRASVMLHLPALNETKEIESVFNAVSKIGMTIRGLYGEGSKGYGNIFQISNQITLGPSEEEIINGLNAMVYQIIEKEKMAREKLKSQYKYELEDRIMRSLGILKSAVLLNSKECMDLLSNVRFGIEMGIIDNIDKRMLNELMVETGAATLQLNANSTFDKRERDLNRARIVRNKLQNQ